MFTNHNAQTSMRVSLTKHSDIKKHTATMLTNLLKVFDFDYNIPALYDALIVSGTAAIDTDTPLKQECYERVKVVVVSLHDMGITTLRVPDMD